ncbi:uncharacterized protein M421DRAFT_183416 [Didymella exigua CBS 183.55]|uniref:Uncharacterized protein n=1 Tax=Didymella exigua CBS 183.55 TaxID=1150837 RepID=A0A6A5RFT8_9PLEO|nr:uncharacterized protein M421DRAFT_183416 [Didymella exigua CBS 183.55]KAF1927171.1 hypothetical protein M421DRAFT_183416 [Didymella exigua CBS 183.55]
MHTGSEAWRHCTVFSQHGRPGKGPLAALLRLQLLDPTIGSGSMISLIANKHSVSSILKHNVSLIVGLGSRYPDPTFLNLEALEVLIQNTSWCSYLHTRTMDKHVAGCVSPLDECRRSGSHSTERFTSNSNAGSLSRTWGPPRKVPSTGLLLLGMARPSQSDH